MELAQFGTAIGRVERIEKFGLLSRLTLTDGRKIVYNPLIHKIYDVFPDRLASRS